MSLQWSVSIIRLRWDQIDHDLLGMVVRQEEDGGNSPDAEESPKDNSTGLARTKIFRARDTVTTTNDDEQGQDTSRQRIVKGNDTQSGLQRVLLLMDQQLDRHHENRTKATSNSRRNPPRSSDLTDRPVLPTPVDVDICGDADTNERADDGLGCRYRETELGADSQPGGRANLSNYHGHDEDSRAVLEGVDGEDAVADGAGDTLTEGDGTDEFRDCC